LFAAAPYGGPVLGPIVGGFVGENIGWRWIFWVQLIFAGVMAVLKCTIPETYAPVILKRRAQKLRREIEDENIMTEQELFKVPLSQMLLDTLIRPFGMLATEPILLLLSLYIALIYGLLVSQLFFCYYNHVLTRPTVRLLLQLSCSLRRGLRLG
jgi:MFS family permease